MFKAVTVKCYLPPLPWIKHYKRSNQAEIILIKLFISYFNPLLSFNLVFVQLHDEFSSWALYIFNLWNTCTKYKLEDMLIKFSIPSDFKPMMIDDSQSIKRFNTWFFLLQNVTETLYASGGVWTQVLWHTSPAFYKSS